MKRAEKDSGKTKYPSGETSKELFGRCTSRADLILLTDIHGDLEELGHHNLPFRHVNPIAEDSFNRFAGCSICG